MYDLQQIFQTQLKGNSLATFQCQLVVLLATTDEESM